MQYDQVLSPNKERSSFSHVLRILIGNCHLVTSSVFFFAGEAHIMFGKGFITKSSKAVVNEGEIVSGPSQVFCP